MQKSSR